MKHMKYWLRKTVSKVYEKVHIVGQPTPDLRSEKYIAENRKRIQDLELVVKEMVDKLDHFRQGL